MSTNPRATRFARRARLGDSKSSVTLRILPMRNHLRSSQRVFAARRRNELLHHGVVDPDDLRSVSFQFLEEANVGSSRQGVALVERSWSEVLERRASNHHATRPRLPTFDFGSGCESLTLEESAFAYPRRWLLLEDRHRRADHHVGTRLPLHLDQASPPTRLGPLVVIEETDPARLVRLAHCSVAHLRNAACSFDEVAHAQIGEVLDDRSCRTSRVVIDHDDVESPAVGDLQLADGLQETRQTQRAPIRCDADRQVLVGTLADGSISGDRRNLEARDLTVVGFGPALRFSSDERCDSAVTCVAERGEARTCRSPNATGERLGSRVRDHARARSRASTDALSPACNPASSPLAAALRAGARQAAGSVCGAGSVCAAGLYRKASHHPAANAPTAAINIAIPRPICAFG